MRRARPAVLLTLAAGLALAAAAADPPPPILKPAVPPPGQTRVRVPITGGPTVMYQVKAQVPKGGKGKSAAAVPLDITVGINTGKRAVATTTMVKGWGYTPGPDKTVTLPELVLVGHQLLPAPKGTKGKDAAPPAAGGPVLARIPGFKVECLDEVAEGTDKVLGMDLLVGVHDLTKGQDVPANPRLYFTEKFFDLNVAASMVKKPAAPPADPAPEADPPAAADPALAVVVAPLAPRAGPVFAYASFNGLETVKDRLGQVGPVNVMVTAATTIPTGVIMSYGMALDLKLDVDPTKALRDFVTLTKKGQFVPTRVREMRIAVQAGKDYKTARDVVIKDLDVVVDTGDSGHLVMVGPNFINRFFPDAVYTVGPDGQLKLYGRVNPDLLQDPKGRKKS